MTHQRIDVSIVIPMYNEETSVNELYERLTRVLSDLEINYEIVFTDDLSTDNTCHLIRQIVQKDARVVLIELLNNFGQTAAIAAGLDHASGEIIIPMDGDLQHAPEDLPAFIREMNNGYDIVSGWRKKRVDNFLLRRFPSMVANRMMALLSGIELHDFGTTFKAYKKSVIKSINLYGDFHRFIPVLCKEKFRKIKIKEIPIQNIVRPHGKSNYGLGRTITVFFDLIRIKFMTSFRNRPLQLFGSLGLLCSLIGIVGLGYIGFARLILNQTLTANLGIPVFLSSVFSILVGLQFIFFGLIGEMLVKNHFDFEHVKPYVLKSVLKQEND